MLKQAIVVALGGALGSIARYKLGGFVLHHTNSWNFPASTFFVNVCGCFAMGALAAIAEHHDLLSAYARIFVFTGLLGGFTTFSAFGYESAFLLRRGMPSMALTYAALSVLCGVVGVLLGLEAVDLLWPPRH
jgi:fluoride exporter